jgi:hypothetical protein
MKAILTAIGTYGVYDPIEPNGMPQMNMGAVSVVLRIGVYNILQYIPFPLDHVRANFDNTSRAKSELLTKKLMDRIYMETARINQRDADLTDVENVIRLKMPYLLRKAINYETFIQEFDYNIGL